MTAACKHGETEPHHFTADDYPVPGLWRCPGPEPAPTLAPRLFGSGNVIHDVVEWKGPEQPSHTYTWGVTRCGMRGKTYDVEEWRRGEASSCKHCEARRARV